VGAEDEEAPARVGDDDRAARGHRAEALGPGALADEAALREREARLRGPGGDRAAPRHEAVPRRARLIGLAEERAIERARRDGPAARGRADDRVAGDGDAAERERAERERRDARDGERLDGARRLGAAGSARRRGGGGRRGEDGERSAEAEREPKERGGERPRAPPRGSAQRLVAEAREGLGGGRPRRGALRQGAERHAE